MFSDLIKAALERDVVGQVPAVNAVVRGVTRLVSGLTPRERQFCVYLLLGPPGTGKTHLVRTLARTLHGSEESILQVDSATILGPDAHSALAAQLAPLYRAAAPLASLGAPLQAPPLSIVVVESLERSPIDLPRLLGAAFEAGHVILPGGGRGSLRNIILFLTSAVGAREILDEAPRIGFSGNLEDEQEEEGRLHELGAEQAREQFGAELLGQLDGLLVFHRIRQDDLAAILDRRIARVNAWLLARGSYCDLQPAAREFLLDRGGRDLRMGARDLLRAHRRFVEFPLADLLVSGRVPGGGRVLVDRVPEEEHLHFTVAEPSRVRNGAAVQVAIT